MTAVDTTVRDDTRRKSEVRRSRRVASVDAARPTRSKAAQRALDRRRQRTGGRMRLPITGRRIAGVPVVVPLLAVVLGALAMTLLLTTKAAQDSYAIDALREQNQELQAGADALKQQVDAGDSAPALAKAAARQGMRPATDAAEMIIGPDGTAHLRGTLTASAGEALPDLNPEPDPVDSIDRSKVDDSEGLGSDGPNAATPPSSATPPNTATSPNSATNPPSATHEPQAPSSQTSPAPNPLPNTSPAPNVRNRVDHPTNVTPPRATPRSNPAPAR